MLRHAKKNLDHHIQSKHEKVRFQCEFCETKTTNRDRNNALEDHGLLHLWKAF